MDKREKRFKWQRILIGLAFLIFVIIILLKFAELKQIADLLRKANWGWLSLAIVLQFGVLATMAGFYKTILKKVSFMHLLKTTTAMVFADHALPSFSVSGNALLYYAARKKDAEEGKASLLIALNVFLNFILYFIMFALGLACLLVLKKTVGMEWIWVPIALVTVALALLARILWTKRGSDHFKMILKWLLKKWPKLRNNVLAQLSKLYEARKKLSKKELVTSLAFIFLNYALKIAVIGLVFLALGNMIGPGILITGYVIAAFISSISYVRIGVYELTMTGAYAGLGIEYNLAFTATLLYRLVSFWLMMLLGFLAFRSIMNKK